MRRLVLALSSPLAALAAIALPTAAQAHPKLLSSTPAAEATVARPTQIRLTFSEALVGPLSGIELVMTAMPGMADHAPMPITGFKTLVQGTDILVNLPRPLPAGSYALKWHAVAADQHRIQGDYTFTVR